ncbi:hypothetical protein TNCT_658161 [Trichonephila clavata]|uniref:C-type lectin domain-containing protein n=1 Tax=Trichonephila clavata TaxID=2740835 RepID=A0A8X6KKA1_TRICU|nr:hypothetical protein TNCT_658161 [Trichonephila clavata]
MDKNRIFPFALIFLFICNTALGCNTDWIFYQGKCYKFISTAEDDVRMARKYCQNDLVHDLVRPKAKLSCWAHDFNNGIFPDNLFRTRICSLNLSLKKDKGVESVDIDGLLKKFIFQLNPMNGHVYRWFNTESQGDLLNDGNEIPSILIEYTVYLKESYQATLKMIKYSKCDCRKSVLNIMQCLC